LLDPMNQVVELPFPSLDEETDTNEEEDESKKEKQDNNETQKRGKKEVTREKQGGDTKIKGVVRLEYERKYVKECLLDLTGVAGLKATSKKMLEELKNNDDGEEEETTFDGIIFHLPYGVCKVFFPLYS